MSPPTFLKTGGFYSYPSYRFERSSVRAGSRAAVMTAPRFCTGSPAKTVIGRSGISKSVMWKNYVAVGTSHMRERSRFGMPVPQTLKGFSFHPRSETGD
jgi:hypothetical protein